MPPALMGRFLMANTSRVISNARKNPGLHIPGFHLRHSRHALVVRVKTAAKVNLKLAMLAASYCKREFCPSVYFFLKKSYEM